MAVKPSGVSKPSSEAKQGLSAKSGERGVSRGCTAPGTVSGTALSNCFLWVWILHDFDDDDYQEEYGETNVGFGAGRLWALGIWFLIRSLRRHSIR